MARRTFLRNPMSVDVGDHSDYEETLGYFNFSQFNGINSNKNYVSIDQASFEEAENMYVDQDGQLHTRPPLKNYSVLPTNYHVVKIFKVNNLTIYHVQDGEQYRLVWQYEGELVQTDAGWVYDEVKIINKNGLYIVFTRNSSTKDVALKGFELYNDVWQYYDADDIIYVPETEIHSANAVEDGENKNLLTTDEYITYLFDSIISNSTVELVEKSVDISITDTNGDVYETTIVFKSNNEKVFTKIINASALDVDRIYVTKIENSGILYYLAFKYSDNFCYFSAGGSIFYQISYPNNNCKSPVLADDGSALYICNTSDFIFYIMTISRVDETIAIDNWNSYNYEDILTEMVNNQKMNMAYSQTGSAFNMLSSKYSNVTLSDMILPFGHSPETGVCVFWITCHYTVTTYWNQVNGYSETGTSYNRTGPGFIMLIYNQGTINTYLVANESSSRFWDDDTMKTEDENGNPIGNKLRVIIGDDNYNTVIVCTPYTTYKSLQTDKNFKPYYAFGYYAQSTNPTLCFVWQTFLNTNEVSLTPGDLRPTSKLDLKIADNYYAYDLLTYYSNDDNSYIIKSANSTGYYTSKITKITEISVGNSHNYDFIYEFSDISDIGNRTEFNHDLDITVNEEEYSDNINFVRISDSISYLTNDSFYYNGQKIQLLRPATLNNILPVYTDGSIIIYYDYQNNNLYSSQDLSNVSVKYKSEGSLRLFMPDILQNFISIVLTKDNVLYWTTDVLNTVTINGEEHQIPALYIEQIDDTKGNWQNLPDEITELTVFSQTSLGVFLQNNVYEFQYYTDSDVYLLTPTKLQLGNKKGSEVLANYDGQSIFITNIKGLISLTYEDFVQSTEQVYNYLTENIMSEYDKFATAPIKLYQYKDWLFMYKENETKLYVYDTRNKSWWYWTHPYGIKQIVFDGNQVVVLTENYLLYYDFETTDFRDLTDTVISWKIVSQKIHFGAPNNYKHIRQLAIITTQNTENMRYKLGFVNYHNLFNLVDTDTVEYEINQLTTMIKRVTFMKTNAFQFIIKSDDTDKNPKYFATPNIAIKYRITERVR